MAKPHFPIKYGKNKGINKQQKSKQNIVKLEKVKVNQELINQYSHKIKSCDLLDFVIVKK